MGHKYSRYSRYGDNDGSQLLVELLIPLKLLNSSLRSRCLNRCFAPSTLVDGIVSRCTVASRAFVVTSRAHTLSIARCFGCDLPTKSTNRIPQ